MEIGTLIWVLLVGCLVWVITAVIVTNEHLSLTFAILSLLCMIAIIPAAVLVSSADYERAEEPYVTHEVMCLNDNSMMSGRFYLRSGYIEEDLYYLYGYKTKSGGMKTQKVKAKNATVYFDDSAEPCVKWYTETKRFWFITSTSYSCDIYVPTDSLVADYTIDLQ